MKILVDESIPLVTVTTLRESGHDVSDLRGTERQALDDEEVWRLALREGRPLITPGKGFFNYRGGAHSGILIVRLRQPNRDRIHRQIIHAMAEIGPHEWKGTMVVVRDRTRSLWR